MIDLSNGSDDEMIDLSNSSDDESEAAGAAAVGMGVWLTLRVQSTTGPFSEGDLVRLDQDNSVLNVLCARHVCGRGCTVVFETGDKPRWLLPEVIGRVTSRTTRALEVEWDTLDTEKKKKHSMPRSQLTCLVHSPHDLVFEPNRGGFQSARITKSK